MLRRTVLAVIALLAVTGPAAFAQPASGQTVPASAPGDIVVGRADAPVTVIEYASVTCPHCAHWHRHVYSDFRMRYVDTGQVRLVFRELPTAPAPVAAAGFLLARCAGPDRYFSVIERLMDRQEEVLATPFAALTRIGAAVGLSEAQVRACLNDRVAYEALEARMEAALAAGVRGTPSFFVQGQRVGDDSLAGLEAAIRPHLER